MGTAPVNPYQHANKFAIIQHRGDPKKVVLDDGKYTVEFMEYVYLNPEYPRVHCINDGAHFTFLDPVKISPLDVTTRRWFAMCSCGAPAVIIGTNPVDKLTSIGEWRLVCYNALTYNKHADGVGGYGA